MIKIAVLIPCYNEALSIEQVVKDFQSAVPQAFVYVFDNNSTDETVQISKNAGAIVRHVKRQGKGAVVNEMFSGVDADVYVMADGDGTYDAQAAPKMIDKLISENLDMVCGLRKSCEENTYRQGHQLGNFMLSYTVRKIFGDEYKDLLTGFRVFSKRFVKSFPALSGGFEIETELAVHSLILRLPTAEVETNYYSRPVGSVSKLNTYLDGFKILKRIGFLILQEKPLQLCFVLFCFFMMASVLISIPVFVTFFQTGLVPRIPTIVFIMGLAILSFLFLVLGFILDATTTLKKEVRRLAYLRFENESTFRENRV
jgi:glycosyltransferase involved in cell wall biosynthesis